MRVGFLVSSVSRKAGGLFQSVRGLAKAVASTSSGVQVFGISDEQSAVDLQEWQPLSVQAFRPQLGAWGYSNELVPAMVGADLDVLSVHGLWKYCSVGSRRWHRQTGRPYVVHPHGMLEPWALRNAKGKKRIAALLYENEHLRRAACLRALSEAEAESIRAYGLRNPICVIPNGVDLPELGDNSTLNAPSAVVSAVLSGSPGYAQRIDALGTAHATATGLRRFGQGQRILLYLGRLHPKKNVANLIRAWNDTFNSQRSSSDSWILAIAGWDQGGYESELKRIAARPSVVFLGPQFGAEKSECYRACDAFILPSLSEGLPMTVLEAWAYAKPVVMTPECNLSEGFSTGAAVRIGSTPEQIAGGLKQLTEMSDADRRAMGARGRDLVATEFSWPRIGEQMRAVYEWVLGGGAPPETVRLCEYSTS
jgi:glycosyltransferase involved in cell wall biosynthesis